MSHISSFFSGGFERKRQVFNSSGTFTVPNNVDFVDLIIIGGGSSGVHNYGGVSGEICMYKSYYVGNTSSISVTVGAGGVADYSPGDGELSSFGSLEAKGGDASTIPSSYSLGDIWKWKPFKQYGTANAGTITVIRYGYSALGKGLSYRGSDYYGAGGLFENGGSSRSNAPANSGAGGGGTSGDIEDSGNGGSGIVIVYWNE